MDSNKKRMLIALEKSLGVVTHAAKKARISKQTHYNWLRTDSEYKLKVEEIAEASIDFTESKLFELIKGAKLPDTKFFQYEGQIITRKTTKVLEPNATAIIFYLKTKGKKRGYVERSEVTDPNAMPAFAGMENLTYEQLFELKYGKKP